MPIENKTKQTTSMPNRYFFFKYSFFVCWSTFNRYVHCNWFCLGTQIMSVLMVLFLPLDAFEWLHNTYISHYAYHSIFDWKRINNFLSFSSVNIYMNCITHWPNMQMIFDCILLFEKKNFETGKLNKKNEQIWKHQQWNGKKCIVFAIPYQMQHFAIYWMKLFRSVRIVI